MSKSTYKQLQEDAKALGMKNTNVKQKQLIAFIENAKASAGAPADLPPQTNPNGENNMSKDNEKKEETTQEINWQNELEQFKSTLGNIQAQFSTLSVNDRKVREEISTIRANAVAANAMADTMREQINALAQVTDKHQEVTATLTSLTHLDQALKAAQDAANAVEEEREAFEKEKAELTNWRGKHAMKRYGQVIVVAGVVYLVYKGIKYYMGRSEDVDMDVDDNVVDLGVAANY